MSFAMIGQPRPWARRTRCLLFDTLTPSAKSPVDPAHVPSPDPFRFQVARRPLELSGLQMRSWSLAMMSGSTSAPEAAWISRSARTRSSVGRTLFPSMPLLSRTHRARSNAVLLLPSVKPCARVTRYARIPAATTGFSSRSTEESSAHTLEIVRLLEPFVLLANTLVDLNRQAERWLPQCTRKYSSISRYSTRRSSSHTSSSGSRWLSVVRSRASVMTQEYPSSRTKIETSSPPHVPFPGRTAHDGADTVHPKAWAALAMRTS